MSIQENKRILESAIKYYNLGFNVIPVGKDKKALIKWEPYQRQRCTLEEIKEWFNGSSLRNIGIVTGEISNLLVVDTDTQESIMEVQNYLPENFITPIQKTPHNGKHFFFKHMSGFSNRARAAPGIDLRTNGGYVVVDPSINNEGNRWEWLKDLSLLDVSPACMPDALLSYIKEFALVFSSSSSKGINDKTKSMSSDVVKYFIEGRRDDDLFHLANCLVKGGGETSFISQVMDIAGQRCNPPFPKKELGDKINSAILRAERKERNIAEEVRQWVLNESCRQSVVILSSDVVRCLQLSSREDEKNVSKALSRLKDEGIIEKYGEKRGVYRIICTETEDIDFMGTEDKIIDISWPFEIQEWVKILPKNIIIIAGEVNAGKTAFLLNTCFVNMGKFKINYYSSEMGAMELRDRLKKFEVNLQNWKDNINFKERSSNFADVIKPNDVNIIDFLEITDEFYKIGGTIKEIYDKLKKGIAIIALQKNPKTDFGLGGMRSVEKARLYISIEHGKIKIVKGKNWAGETNPNGLIRNFKLIQGAKFIATTGWERKHGDNIDYKIRSAGDDEY